MEFVKLADLPTLGFSKRFGALAMEGFPGAVAAPQVSLVCSARAGSRAPSQAANAAAPIQVTQ